MDKKVIVFIIFILVPAFCFALEPVDINTATLEQLETLTGIGPKYAQAIIDNRPYSSVDDLLRVNGIGEKTLEKIKYQGLAYVGEKSEILNSKSETNSNVQNLNTENVAPIMPAVYPGGVYINEILPSPKGADETDEWIELYNSNTSDVDLSGWKIQDINGTPSNFTIPAGTKILTNNFLVLKRPETKIMLNNDADGLNLLTPDEKIIDSINFTSALTGQSYNKVNFTWVWSATLTPGFINIALAPAQNGSASGGKNLSKAKKPDNNIVEAKDLTAGLSQPAESLGNPWPLFFTALAITIISAFIVLFIKLKITKI